MTISKKTHDILIIAGAIVCGLGAVLSFGFSDYAKKPFWWTAWEVFGVVCIVAWIAGFLFLEKKESAINKEEAQQYGQE